MALASHLYSHHLTCGEFSRRGRQPRDRVRRGTEDARRTRYMVSKVKRVHPGTGHVKAKVYLQGKS